MSQSSVTWLFPIIGVSEGECPHPPLSSLQLFLSAVELAAVGRFRLSGDRWRAAVGRLATRLLLSHLTGLDWWKVPIQRTPHGKPFLDVEEVLKQRRGEEAQGGGPGGGGERGGQGEGPVQLRSISFSISHHGDWLLLVGQWRRGWEEDGTPVPLVELLGCDVTRVELSSRVKADYEAAFPSPFPPPQLIPPLEEVLPSASSSRLPLPSPFLRCAEVLSEYFEAFQSVLTEGEWARIRRHRLPRPDEVEGREGGRGADSTVRRGVGMGEATQPPPHCVSAFAVVWSAKEAVVKAVGAGLSMDLQLMEVVDDEEEHSQPSAAAALPSTAPSAPAQVSAPSLYSTSLRIHWRLSSSLVSTSSSSIPCASALPIPQQRHNTGGPRSSQVGSSCSCSRCCAALHWELLIAPIDDRHTVAIARAFSSTAPASTSVVKERGRSVRDGREDARREPAASPDDILAGLGQPHGACFRVITIEELLRAVQTRCSLSLPQPEQ